MTIKLLNEYTFHDITIRYLLDTENGHIGLQLLPSDLKLANDIKKNETMESMVQLKLTGDIYDAAYAMGNSLRNSETVLKLVYEGQNHSVIEGNHHIDTMLIDHRGYKVTHCLRFKEGTHYIRVHCVFTNTKEETCTLEMMESFSLSGLSPYLTGDGHGCMKVHRIRSVWSQEGLHEAIHLDELQLEPAWDPHAVRCERFGQAGSMPVNKFFPFAAVEDCVNHVFWGAQIAHHASWQMEFYRKDDGLSFSGGLADREFGHWMKEVKKGESFTTPEAILTVAHTESFDILTARLTEAGLEGIEDVPETEAQLPLIFNEYCTTWGKPSHENITGILEKMKDKGFRYFVIDAGWYKEEGVPWDVGMGDYEVSKELFPEGLEKTAQAIRDAGMIPGIWFEIETVGSASRAYHMEKHLLHKDGKALTSYFRRFWNMRDPWVEQYLTEKVIGTLKKYHFGYLKIDYNETIGIGCDGAESLGEGLRQNMQATSAFIEKIKREVPGIVIENCASGGHRLEPGLMSQVSMASFSDAHECVEIPIIAANLHRIILPRQSQIWAVIRTNDSLKRIAYSVINTFLGRLCISGDVTELSADQWKVLDEGMQFYKEIVPIIRDGQSYLYGQRNVGNRYPKGWQGLVRIGKEGKAFMTLHVFDGVLPEEITIKLPDNCPSTITKVYSDKKEEVVIENGVLRYTPRENMKALAIGLCFRV